MKKAKLLKYMSWWPPLLAAGIRAKVDTKHFARVEVKLVQRFYNTNYVGSHYGGSLYSMTDPWYMLLLLQRLGRDYIVWDKAANIRFRKPGKGTVTARFEVDDALVARIKTTLETEPKMDLVLPVLVKDKDGDVVAEVEKVVYIKKKERKEVAQPVFA